MRCSNRVDSTYDRRTNDRRKILLRHRRQNPISVDHTHCNTAMNRQFVPKIEYMNHVAGLYLSS